MAGQEEIEFKKKYIVERLRKRKYKITAQRRLIIDTIIEHECTCCKEIYYLATEKDSTIGIATVYRLLALLEEMGLIKRKNMYQIDSEHIGEKVDSKEDRAGKVIVLKEEKKFELLEPSWYYDMKQFLKQRGMIENEDISIVVKVRENC